MEVETLHSIPGLSVTGISDNSENGREIEARLKYETKKCFKEYRLIATEKGVRIELDKMTIK